ncbi:MAG TPA: ABC transporter substrate-binding protein, partial [Acidimicrobiales bacterium]|nr:ABC transporter substrate-binding protein [Acidimicrobiales bacterium]
MHEERYPNEEPATSGDGRAQITRRQAMGYGARAMGALALGGAVSRRLVSRGALSGVERGGLDAARPPAAMAKYGSVTLQLNWLINVQFGGSFLAETKGYYADAGVDVTLVPGGPNVNVEPLVVQGKADVGISPIESLASARTAGADLV